MSKQDILDYEYVGSEDEEEIEYFDMTQIEAKASKNGESPSFVAVPKSSIGFDPSMLLPPEDAIVGIELSKDLMEAFILISSPRNGGRPLQNSDIVEAFKKYNICFGIDMEVVKELMVNPTYDERILVARGQRPVNGEDAKIEFLVKLEGRKKPQENPDGSVDFHELELFQQIDKGRVICRKRIHTEGTQGKTVTGMVRNQIQGKDKPLPTGTNTIITPDGSRLVSLVAGRLVMTSSRISVMDVYEVNSDVNIGTGDISFKGNLIINGNVSSGYTVEATGDLVISGTVESANIICGGMATIKGGIIGGGRGTVNCKGDLRCKFMEHANVMVHGSIWSQAIIHCDVGCGKDLTSTGDIIGAQITAGGHIEANVCGSNAGVSTKLEAGVNPFLSSMEEALIKELATVRRQIDEAARLEAVLLELQKAERLDPDKAEMLSDIQFTKMAHQNMVSQIETELSSINSQKWSKDLPEIKVAEQIFAGSTIKIGEAIIKVTEPMKGRRFLSVEEQIVMK